LIAHKPQARTNIKIIFIICFHIICGRFDFEMLLISTAMSVSRAGLDSFGVY
jgi:hypothetical protein